MPRKPRAPKGGKRKPSRARKPAAAKARAEPRGRGRPSKYRPEFAVMASVLCARGATDADLADAFGVAVSTIWRWQSAYDDFRSATVAGKDAADTRVERALYQRAVGYTYDATKVMQAGGRPVYAPYREHVAPDVNACRLWLLNRRPDQWRDTSRIEFDGRIRREGPDLSNLTDVELGVLAQILDRAAEGDDRPPLAKVPSPADVDV